MQTVAVGLTNDGHNDVGLDCRYALIRGAGSWPRAVAKYVLRLSLQAKAETVKGKVDDGRRVESEQLAEEQAADDGDAERAAEFVSSTRPKCQRQRPQ